MSKILEILAARQAVIDEVSTQEPNYFKVQDYLELDKFSTYFFITPRSIGKSYSCWELVFDVYEANGEYSVWMRTSLEEIKEILKDYKANRPAGWRDYAELQSSQLIDKRDGSLICKFVPLSTVSNLASITGDGCFGIIYDEFLKHGKINRQAGSYKAIAGFIKTVERNHLLTFIGVANMTTLNSEILSFWDLWIDRPEVDDLENRMRWRYIKEWENPPKLSRISTADLWAKKDEKLKNFMDNAGLLDNSDHLIMPESRLGSLRNMEKYNLEGVIYTLSLDDSDRYVIREGDYMGGFSYALTTEDGYEEAGLVRPHDLAMILDKIIFNLEQGNIIFTTHLGKETWVKYLVSYTGKLQRRLE